MNILDIKRMVKQAGEVGIEIEVEGQHLPNQIQGWDRVPDGSLRGESCEYVITKPCKRSAVRLMLNRVEGAYQENGTKVVESPRQSIHIHINVQDMSLTQVYNFIVLFLIFEQPLVDFCGDHRAGNLFCLRSSDAEGLITMLEQASSPYRIDALNTQKIRYAAMNVSALFKYGSLEFRSMRGTADFPLIKRWIDLLLSVKDRAKGFVNPIAIIEEFSKRGTINFVKDTFGKESKVITAAPGWEEQLFESMRSVQTIAYSGDWEGLSKDRKESKEEREPKLRRARMDDAAMQRVVNQAAEMQVPDMEVHPGEVRAVRAEAPRPADGARRVDEWIIGA